MQTVLGGAVSLPGTASVPFAEIVQVFPYLQRLFFFGGGVSRPPFQLYTITPPAIAPPTV